MNAPRLLYRTRQFWQAFRSTTVPGDQELAGLYLTPLQIALFEQMQLSEQTHSLRILKTLLAQGENDPDLCAAALLHDVGKCRFPLRLGEQVLIVLARAIFPGWIQRWGKEPLQDSPAVGGWRRAFVVAVQHPEWGAEMARSAGVSPLAVALIRRHQEKSPFKEGAEESLEDCLLCKLQAVDDNS